jgi:hypothetical protein
LNTKETIINSINYYKTINKNLNEDIEINKYENKIFLMDIKYKIINKNDIQFLNMNEFNFINNFKYIDPYINYINYLIIINSLTIQEIKNLCRYLNIKWKIMKDKLNLIKDFDIFNRYNFCNFNEIKYLLCKDELYNKFLSILNIFFSLEKLDKNNNIDNYVQNEMPTFIPSDINFSINKNNLTLYFFIKYFYEYFL